MLIIRRSLLAVELGDAQYPSNTIDVLQERLMAYGGRTPMNWVQKLRAYGKQVRETSTCLGYIAWSKNSQRLTYGDLDLTMAQFRVFIQQQLQQTQAQLQELLLVNWDDIPPLYLQALKDNPRITTPGWSFLKDPRNAASLQSHDRWLINRLTAVDKLCKEFLHTRGQGEPQWRKAAAEHYLQRVDAFLERLLIVVHIVAGQPACGTGLFSLQYCNNVHGLPRNIYVENGLVSFVTCYHKGYSIQGSNKIIHRYLPREVSELVVSYLSVVLPFTQQLRLLAFDDKLATTRVSPFLWALPSEKEAREGAQSPWPSSRLSTIISCEFRSMLHTKANIQIWRHVAIAINRRHLRQARFKKDFDLGTTWNDEQAGHGTLLAGSIYARGIEEADGHIASMRTEYLQISQEWHAWLGFAPRQQKRRAEEALEKEVVKCCRCGQ
jgi:hypothetical protein